MDKTNCYIKIRGPFACTIIKFVADKKELSHAMLHLQGAFILLLIPLADVRCICISAIKLPGTITRLFKNFQKSTYSKRPILL